MIIKRSLKVIVINAIVAVVLMAAIDSIMYVFFRTEVQQLFTRYGHGKIYSRGYPRFHFEKKLDRGFDIQPGFESVANKQPAEIASYKVWGNEMGCFDDSWAVPSGKPFDAVYLAGDSFTWGYAPFEQKFGTLLEQRLARPVLSCGVSHTGQRHQFLKFKSIFEQGVHPQTVIVNVTDNDLANDFFFPHSTVIDGYLVENVNWCVEAPDNDMHDIQVANITQSRTPDAELFEQYSKMKTEGDSIAVKYSFSYNSFSFLLNRIRTWLSQFQSGDKGSVRDGNSCPDFHHTPYGEGRFGIDEIVASQSYQLSSLAEPNRRVLEEWVAHSKTHNYRLIFSLIPEKDTFPGKQVTRKQKMAFVSSLGAEAYDFGEYPNLEDIAHADLYYLHDGHFNAEGNRQYAEFLATLLK